MITYYIWLYSAPNKNGILDRQPTVSVRNTSQSLDLWKPAFRRAWICIRDTHMQNHCLTYAGPKSSEMEKERREARRASKVS